jgi:hypothetical protein
LGKLVEGKTKDIRVTSKARHEWLIAQMQTTASQALVAADLLGKTLIELAM